MQQNSCLCFSMNVSMGPTAWHHLQRKYLGTDFSFLLVETMLVHTFSTNVRTIVGMVEVDGIGLKTTAQMAHLHPDLHILEHISDGFR